MGYAPADIAQIASTLNSPPERAQLFAIAASIAPATNQKFSWVVEASPAYVSAQFTEAIGSAEFVAEGVPKYIPNDPNVTSLLKRAKEVGGWAYLRSGEIEKFNSIAADYAKMYSVAKNDFKEPTLPSMLPFSFDGQNNIVFDPSMSSPTSYSSTITMPLKSGTPRTSVTK